MILVCDQCKASFLVPASLFTAGPRMVRCARCGHAWKAKGEEKTATKPPPRPAPPVPEPPPAPPPAEKQPEPQPEAPPKPARKPFRLPDFSKARWYVGAPVATLLVLLGLAALFHAPILARWPQTQPFYALLRLAPPVPVPEKLILRHVHSVRKYMDGAMHLVVDGEIFNQSEKNQFVPALQAEAAGPDGKIIQSWRIEAPQATLKVGTAIPFTSAILSPEGTVVEVNLSFVEPPHDEP